jgi:antitoxin ChpS
MQTTLREIGNSIGSIIPKPMLQNLGLTKGDHIEIIEENGKIVITPKLDKPKYTLDELLAKCDESAPMPQTLAEWEQAQPVGNEI